MHFHQMPLLRMDNFGCFPRRRPFAIATCIPSRVRARIRSDSNSATIASTLKKQAPDWIERVVHGPIDAELHLLAGQIVDDVFRAAAAIAPGGPAWGNQCVPLSASGRRLASTRGR